MIDTLTPFISSGYNTKKLVTKRTPRAPGFKVIPLDVSWLVGLGYKGTMHAFINDLDRTFGDCLLKNSQLTVQAQIGYFSLFSILI